MTARDLNNVGGAAAPNAYRKAGLKPALLRVLGRLGLLRMIVHVIESYRALGHKPVALAPDALPVPPPRLIVRVAGHADAAGFLQSGKRAADSIAAALDRAGVSINKFDAILDFGCGCGRVLRHWRGGNARIYGSDLSKQAIAWSRANLPFGEFKVNGFEPPLSYANASFDLVYALSVFTHLPVATQFRWRDELGRVLRPGGYLLLTVHGDAYLPQLTRAEQELYEKGECVVRWAQVAGSNMCGTYHPASFVRDRFAAGWELIEHVPRGALGNPEQDLILLRKLA